MTGCEKLQFLNDFETNAELACMKYYGVDGIDLPPQIKQYLHLSQIVNDIMKTLEQIKPDENNN